jgi:HTH-type transcriptional regulator/antitoxin MqsA
MTPCMWIHHYTGGLMRSHEQEFSATMTCPNTGTLLRSGIRPFAVPYDGSILMVDLPGYYPGGDGGGVHVGGDLSVVETALRWLKALDPR